MFAWTREKSVFRGALRKCFCSETLRHYGGFTRKGIQSFHLIKPQSHLSGPEDIGLKLWPRGGTPTADKGQFTQYQSYIDFLVRIFIVRGWILDLWVCSDTCFVLKRFYNMVCCHQTWCLISIELEERTGGWVADRQIHNNKQMFKERFESCAWMQRSMYVLLWQLTALSQGHGYSIS